jgi:parallel beta-helix repeat protein
MIDSAGSSVRGITFKQYGGTFPGSHAAVYGRSNSQTFEDNLFAQNNAAGLSVYTSPCEPRTAGAIVRNNEFAYNGQMGLHVSCTSQAQVLNNSMHHNRWYPAGWTLAAHGGMKADRAVGLVAKNNNAIDNLGQGLWLDIFSNDATVVGNLAIGNTGIGLFFEGSQRAMMVNNRVALNQEAGIWIANSTDARIYNNALANNGNGRDPGGDDINDANIAIISQRSRLAEPVPHTRNVTIKNNVSTMENGQRFNLHVYAHAIGYVPGVNATGDSPPDGNDLNDLDVRTDKNAFWRYAALDQPFTADPLFHWAFRSPAGTTHKDFFSIIQVMAPHNDAPGQERPGQELTTPVQVKNGVLMPDFDKAGPVNPFLVPLSLDSKGGPLLNAGVELDEDMAAAAGVVKACGKNVGPFTFQ